jgi:hypothetical protein
LATGSGDPAAAQKAYERFFDPSIEWDMSGVIGWAEKQVYRGQEVPEFLRAWADSWREWRFDLDDLRDAERGMLFAAIHERGIGAESGASVDQRRYFAITMHEGRAVRVQMFSESGDAREATGLPA